MLGDAVYESGTAQEFRDCYSWGRFRGRTRAALGNHEYGSGNAAAAIAYFRLPRSGYYSYDLGDWHVVVLNSNCRPAGGCERGSPQQRWLAADLAANPASCTVAYMHHPRFSSGLHGSRHHARRAVDDAQPRRRRRRPRRPRPPLRAVRAVRGHPLVRRRQRRPQPLSGAAPPVAAEERRGQRPHLRRPQADAARRTATTGASSPSPGRPTRDSGSAPAARRASE